jgi:hypothetical protein
MYNVRETWTDDRMDDFAKQVDRRFDGVDGRFDGVDRRLDKIDDRFADLQRTLLQVGGGMIATLLVGFFGLIATQL